MPLFKELRYGRLLYETLRSYFSVNARHTLTLLYKYCAALIFPLQAGFTAYDIARKINEVIANCKWVIGQLTNTLNYLFDPILNRIFIDQATIQGLVAPEFNYPTTAQMQEFDENPVQCREFTDRAGGNLVQIHVPVATDMNALVATIEQIRIIGIDYEIITF